MPQVIRCPHCQKQMGVPDNAAGKNVRCPACNKPCVRLISPVKVTGKYSTSDSRVKELGMTKYKKAGDGVYEKTTGSGPNVIRRK